MKVVDQLYLYRARAEELINSRLLREGFNPGFTISWNRIQGLRFSSKEPDETCLRSFLITFRQFVTEREPVFIFKIYNICQKHLTGDKLKEYLFKSRKAWINSLKTTGIMLVYNNREMSPESINDLWINGYYFHSDERKYLFLRSLLPYERMLIRSIFLNFLLDATKQVLYINNIIKAGLNEGLFRLE
jgi:hypothetical protein